MDYEFYAGLLYMAEAFRDDGETKKLRYAFDEELQELKESYGLEKTAGMGEDFERAKAVLYWLSVHTVHDGCNCKFDGERNGKAMLDYAFDRGEEGALNCALLAQTLTECLLSLGMKARTVYLYPCSPYDVDNHVVTELWSRDMEKFIMLDPTYGLYLLDQENMPLGICEIRHHLAHRIPMHICDTAHYNGNRELNWEGDIKPYYAKDFFRFECQEIQGFGTKERKNSWLSIAPDFYDSKKAVLAGIDYRISLYGEQDWLAKWKSFVKDVKYSYCGLSILEQEA